MRSTATPLTVCSVFRCLELEFYAKIMQIAALNLHFLPWISLKIKEKVCHIEV